MEMVVNLIVTIAALTFGIATAQTSCPIRCRSCENNVAECSRRSLTAPPRVYPTGTRIINLEGNHIRVIAERTFATLDSAEVLKISGNKIVALRNDAFSPLKNLMVLDLMDNRISRISRKTFKDLTKLRTLSLNRNRIESLEGILQYVPSLYQLNVANNRIVSLGQHDLSAMTRVHYIDLRDNLISNIHGQTFMHLQNLRYLFLNNNPLASTPPFQFSSSVLQLVDFSNCRLTAVPGPFPPSVSDLRLGHNKIMQVNNSDFLNITDLQLLALNDNELHFLADRTLTHLTQLQEVWLRHNSLVYIPRGIPNNVRKVYMDSNNIQQIEEGIFSNMSHLDYLTVESNQINRIQPNTFRGLRFLNTLNFQGNRIRHLEQNTFADLGSLSALLLSNNPLERIDDGAFKNLGNLTHLFMSYITEENFQLNGNFLPEMLRLQTLHLVNSPGLASDLMNFINNPATPHVRLESVTQLDLSYNTLEWISPRIREVFPNLMSMPLDGNPLQCSWRLKWLRDWMVNSDASFHNYDEVVCESPLRLKDRRVRDMKDSDWANDDEVNNEAASAAQENRQQGNNVPENGGGDLTTGDTPQQLISQPGLPQPGIPSPRERGNRQGVGKRSKDDKQRGKGKGKGRKGNKDKKNKKKDNKTNNKKDKGSKNKKSKKEKEAIKKEDVTTATTKQ